MSEREPFMNWIKKLFKKENNVTVIDKYKEYRKISKELNNRIMDKCLDRDVFLKAASLLDAAQGDIVVLDTEDEMSVVMDFALREYKVNKQTTVEIYREKIGGKNEIEKEILDAFVSSYTSLFKVISISKKEKSLILEDILDKKDSIKIIDRALSESAMLGVLVFIRIVSFYKLSKTDGIQVRYV